MMRWNSEVESIFHTFKLETRMFYVAKKSLLETRISHIETRISFRVQVNLLRASGENSHWIGKGWIVRNKENYTCGIPKKLQKM